MIDPNGKRQGQTGWGDMPDAEKQRQPPSEFRHIRRHRIGIWTVAGIWGLASAWVGICAASGPHTVDTSRWMINITMLFMTAAATATIGYLVQMAITDRTKGDRQFELGYSAGRYDALHESRPRLTLVETLPGNAHGSKRGKTGT